MTETVLVTEVEFKKGEQVFRATPGLDIQPAPVEEAPLAETVRARRCRAVIVGVAPYRGLLYGALAEAAGGQPALIARFGVGHDSVDKALARQHNILVTNTPGTLDLSVAEHTIWLIGALVRHVAPVAAHFQAGEFAPQTGSEVRGKTLAVLGLGGIGRRVAAIARHGLGMRVVACDIRPAGTLTAGEQRNIDTYTNDIAVAIGQADIVTVHLPAIAETRRVINAARLAWMKPSAMLVNTSRGSLVDEAALYDALAHGQLAGAALDVFEREPYVPVSSDKDLRKLPNVVLTPHIGSNTVEANARMAQAALANVVAFFAGRLNELARVDQPTVPR